MSSEAVAGADHSHHVADVVDPHLVEPELDERPLDEADRGLLGARHAGGRGQATSQVDQPSSSTGGSCRSVMARGRGEWTWEDRTTGSLPADAR
jgi:hypothetical protein